MENIVQFQVDRPTGRLDQFLVESIPHVSRSHLQKLIHQGNVRVSTPPHPAVAVTRPGAGIKSGQVITVYLPTPQPQIVQPETIPLDIVFEDADIVVLNKPAGLVVHPARGHAAGTLVNALLARYPDLAALAETGEDAINRPGLVHRLDRDTSGLLLVARTPQALQQLRQQFKARRVEKTYLALVFGRPEVSAGIIDVPLGRDPAHRQKFAPRADGKSARTHYRLVENFGLYSLLEIGLETGRTHQIRVHLAWLKCPVVGDMVYGHRKNPLGLNRQFLHAWRLSFEHPRTGEVIQLEAPLADDLQAVLAGLR